MRKIKGQLYLLTSRCGPSRVVNKPYIQTFKLNFYSDHITQIKINLIEKKLIFLKACFYSNPSIFLSNYITNLDGVKILAIN